mmetsp:Transcript_52490/g.169301  ORF Transcript_52490/g.169301 Transcript_52490/m.169301 type:complete len:189 (-) Transcript_52490:169-735(-)
MWELSWETAWFHFACLLILMTFVRLIGGAALAVATRRRTHSDCGHLVAPLLRAVRVASITTVTAQWAWAVTFSVRSSRKVQQASWLQMGTMLALVATGTLMAVFWTTWRLDLPRKIVSFRSKRFGRLSPADSKFNTTCSICLEGFAQKDWVVHLPCHHVFHTTCGGRWFSEGKACPYRCPPSVGTVAC